MIIDKITARFFRNLKNVSFSPHPILNLLVGDNGQGKTSLVEAIDLLATLKSFRTSHMADLVQKGEAGFTVEAGIKNTQWGSYLLKYQLSDGRRSLWVDTKNSPSSQFLGRFRAVVFSPESLNSIKAGPEVRRDLVDQANQQLDFEATQAQKEFHRVLRQRNACLKQGRDGLTSPSQLKGVLESLEPSFLLTGTKLTQQRLRFLDRIFVKLGPILNTIGCDTEGVEFDYQSSSGAQNKGWKERTEEAIFERLCSELKRPEMRRTEEKVGSSLVGPHRHDIRFLFNGNDSRIFCSQGQQRALILAFKMAEIVYHSEVFGSYPLLLLDDVLSELDERKRDFLVGFLKQSQAQTFLTTTDYVGTAEKLAEKGAIFEVKAGEISPKTN